MQPQSKADAFQPRWRHFHAQSIVWVQNPLSHDVVFQVADEYNNPYQYKLGAGKVSELPGGAVATLGVKAIVDELIQNNKNDVLRIWDREVRQKYEDEIILRIKEAPRRDEKSVGGQIDLSIDPGVADEDETPEEAPESTIPDPSPGEGATYEPEFPDARKSEEAVAAAKAASAKLPAAKVIED